jgi:hypothetical protein
MGILAIGMEVTYQTNLGGGQVQTPVKAFFAAQNAKNG